MSQNIFANPFVSDNPVLTGSGNGTLTINKLTHFTINQVYTVICTAIAPFTIFKVIGSLDGPVGTAQIGVQFVDQDLKIFFTLAQGPDLFAVGDSFEFEVTQGTDLNRENIDLYDQLPQKNFSQGLLGASSGDDNIRFSPTAHLAFALLQNIAFTAVLTNEDGNDIRIQYFEAIQLTPASKEIQDLTYEAVTPGVSSNGISIEYIAFTPAEIAEITIQQVNYSAVLAGAAGNSITIAYTTGGTAGSEVVTVVGTAISVQIQTGVSTAQQIEDAVNADIDAGALVLAAITGTGSETQTAPVSATNLVGGSDSIGAAGSEVVDVTGDAITVTMEPGVSTATQIKDAIEADGPADALVTITITGSGSNPQTLEDPIFLEGGTDAAGTLGDELVSVEDRLITVQFEGGNVTATALKAIIDGSDASDYVTTTIVGSGSTPQTTTATAELGGGAPVNTFQTNSNEITAEDDFYQGNASLIAQNVIAQGRLYVRKAAKFKSTVSLNDVDWLTNLSGPPVTNLQQYINYLIQNSKIQLTMTGFTSLSWTSPNLTFGSNFAFKLLDTGVVMQISTSQSPLSIPDGQSVYALITRGSSGTATAVVAAQMSASINAVLLATRIGTVLYMADGTAYTSGESKPLGTSFSDQNMTYIGLPSRSASAPVYTGSLKNVTQGQSLLAGISSLDTELDKLFKQCRIRADATPSKSVYVSGSDQTLLDGTKIGVEVLDLMLAFSGAKINFATGVITKEDGSTALGTNFTPFAIGTNKYLWYSIALVPDSVESDNTWSATLEVTPAVADGTTANNAPKASFSNITGLKKLGYVLVQQSGSDIAVISSGAIVNFGAGSGSGGGGSVSGGGNLIWYPHPISLSPADGNDDQELPCLRYGHLVRSKAMAAVRVPDSYVSGTQIILKGLTLIAPPGSDNVLMRAETTVYRPGSPTGLGVWVSTNTQLTIASTSTRYSVGDMDLTDVNGLLNFGLGPLQAGDVLKIELVREVGSESVSCPGDIDVEKSSAFVVFS